jgi:hypothetical protein
VAEVERGNVVTIKAGGQFASTAKDKLELDTRIAGIKALHYYNEETDKITLSNYDPTTFESSHFDERNIVAHLRLKDRLDADGDRVLFIEEVQSDWHQEGRKRGYFPEGTSKPLLQREFDKYSAQLQQLEDSYTERTGRDVRSGRGLYKGFENSPEGQEWVRISDLQDEVKEQKDLFNTGVPSGPFKNNAWVELAVKKALRIAAEGNYTAIAWTTGEQQADRYNLRQHIKSVRATPVNYGPDLVVYKLFVGAHDGTRASFPVQLQEEELADYFGADLSQKIIDKVAPHKEEYLQIDHRIHEVNKELGRMGAQATTAVEYTEARDATWDALIGEKNSLIERRRALHELTRMEDLDVYTGGEGMMRFYDTALPQIVKKVARKHDKTAEIDAHAVQIRKEGDTWPFTVSIESDGKKFWLWGQNPLRADTEKVKLSREFSTFDEADKARNHLYYGRGEQPYMLVTDEISGGVMSGQTLFSVKSMDGKPLDPSKRYYHVTLKENVSGISDKGILPLRPSNWIQAGTGERYGNGEIFAFEELEDAVRWATKWDWDLNYKTGTGDIAIVPFR